MYCEKLKCTLTSVWNGDADGPTDDVVTNGTTGNWTVNAGNNVITIEAAALTGNAVTILSTTVISNAMATAVTVVALLGGVIASQFTRSFASGLRLQR